MTTSSLSVQWFWRVVIWLLIELDIPQLSTSGIQFDDGCFYWTYSLQSSSIHSPISSSFDATGLENYISFGDRTPSSTSYVVKNRTSLNSIPLDVEDLWIGRLDISGITEFSFNTFQSLESLVIGNGIFWEVTSFELNNLPQLQSVKLGYYAFYYVHSVVFESDWMDEWIDDSDLPKLQSIQLDSNALKGDSRDDRATISNYPYNYKNTLTMRSKSEWNDEWIDLPSLTSFKGDWYNFYAIGSVILESNHLVIDWTRYSSIIIQWNPIQW